MRMLRVAALVAATVGLSVVAVGCGPPAGTEKTDPAKASKQADQQAAQNSQRIAEGSAGGEVGKKAKDVRDKVNKELEPLKKGLDSLNEKVTTAAKAAGTDAEKLKGVQKLEADRDSAKKQMDDINAKIADLAKMKDVASVEKAEKDIMAEVEKLKTTLKDHMPK